MQLSLKNFIENWVRGSEGSVAQTRDEAEGVFQGSRQNIEAMVEEEQEEEKTSLEPLPEDLTEY